MASPVPSLGAVLKPLADAIKGLTAVVGAAAPSITAAGRAISGTFDGIGAAVSSLKVASASAANLLGAMLQPLKPAIQAVSIAVTNSFLGVASALKSGIDSVAMYVGGKLTDLFKPLAPAIDWLRSQSGAMFQKLRDYLGPVGTAVVEFGGKLAAIPVRFATAITAGIGATTKFAGAVAGMLGEMASAGANALKKPFAVLDSFIASVGQGITRFVALYDPGRVVVFQYAVDSLYAAIGKSLAPAMDAVTQIVKALGSAISGAGEQGQTMIAAIAAGAVGLIAFAAAMALVQAVTTGGVLPILGALVGAFGGLEAVTGGLQPILDQLAPTLSGVMNVVGTAMEAVSAQVGSILPALAQGIDYAAGVVGVLVEAFTQLGPAISAVVGVFMAIQTAVRPLQELIISILVGGVVLLAKEIAAIAPVITAVIGVFGNVAKQLFEPLTQVVALIGTVAGQFVELIGEALQLAVPYIVQFGEVIGDMVKTVVGWIKELLAMIGIVLPEVKKIEAPKGELGQAPPPVRGTSTSDVESVLRKARESAFSLGGGGQKPEVKTALNTGQTTQAVNDVKKQLNDLVSWLMNALPHFIVSEMPLKIYNYLVEVAKTIIDNFPGSGSLKQAEKEAGEVSRGERSIGKFGVETPAGRVELGDVAPIFRIQESIFGR